MENIDNLLEGCFDYYSTYDLGKLGGYQIINIEKIVLELASKTDIDASILKGFIGECIKTYKSDKNFFKDCIKLKIKNEMEKKLQKENILKEIIDSVLEEDIRLNNNPLDVNINKKKKIKP